MDITHESGPCLVEFTPSPGLSPDRVICPDLRRALARAVEMTSPGPASVWPDEFEHVQLSITCALPNGSLADPQLSTAGPLPDVYMAALNWHADYTRPIFLEALTGEENPSLDAMRAAVLDPAAWVAAFQAVGPAATS